MTLRNGDITTDVIPQIPDSGGGVAFLDFVEKELMPFVDCTYPTDPSDPGPPGHSMGGHF